MKKTTAQLISEACKLAEDGMYVSPWCVRPDPDKPGKHLKIPLINWKTESSIDSDVIEKMPWGGKATHVGIDCGRSNIWCVDIDDKSALALFPQRPTRVDMTISGGMHFIYRAGAFDQRNTSHYPVKHADIRAEGGAMVWYGNGEGVEDTILPWPWSTPFIEGRPGGKKSLDGGADKTVMKGEGRNHHLISAAGVLMMQWPKADLHFVFNYLLGYTGEYHIPPLDRAEVLKVATSAMRWRDESEELPTNEYFGMLCDMPYEQPPLKLCGDWLREKSVTTVFSRAGEGKTAWVSNLVWCLRTGQPFLGMPCAKIDRVLWINGDMPRWQVIDRLGYLGKMMTLWHLEFSDLFKRRDDLIRIAGGFEAVVFDNRPTLFQIADSNIAELWDPMSDLLREIANLGPAVIMQTHGGKGEDNTSSFGSSAQEWRIDNNIRLSTRKPTPSELLKYHRKCNDLAPEYKCDWHKHRLSAKPPSREYLFTMLPSNPNFMHDRLIVDWEMFYDDKGKSIIEGEK